MKPTVRLAVLVTASSLLLAAAGCQQTVAPSNASERRADAPASRPGSATTLHDMARQRMAVQALVTNLLDDADPPRFADTDQPLVCGEGSIVYVNGVPLEPGAVVPAASFMLDFQLSGACPLGIAGPRLSGPVQMVVVRDDEHGLVPVVLGQH